MGSFVSLAISNCYKLWAATKLGILLKTSWSTSFVITPFESIICSSLFLFFGLYELISLIVSCRLRLAYVYSCLLMPSIALPRAIYTYAYWLFYSALRDSCRVFALSLRRILFFLDLVDYISSFSNCDYVIYRLVSSSCCCC